MTIGLQVYRARKEAGLSQQQLANLLGMKKQSISDIECERRAISLKMIKKLATELGTEIVIYP